MSIKNPTYSHGRIQKSENLGHEKKNKSRNMSIQKKFSYIYIRCKDKSGVKSPCNWRDSHGHCSWKFKKNNIRKSPCSLLPRQILDKFRIERLHETYLRIDRK